MSSITRCITLTFTGVLCVAATAKDIPVNATGWSPQFLGTQSRTMTD